MIELNKIYNENCLETMKRMEDNFVDLTVTSPLYAVMLSLRFINEGLKSKHRSSIYFFVRWQILIRKIKKNYEVYGFKKTDSK